MKIYIVLETVASNDSMVTKALRAFKSKENAEKFIDEHNIDKSVKSPSVSYIDYQEVNLES